MGAGWPIRAALSHKSRREALCQLDCTRSESERMLAVVQGANGDAGEEVGLCAGDDLFLDFGGSEPWARRRGRCGAEQ